MTLLLQRLCLGVGVAVGGISLWLLAGMRGWPRVDPLPAQHVSLVVVLSSGVGPDSQLDGASRERIRAGIATANTLKARLVTTRTAASPTGPTSDYGQRLLIDPSGLAPRWTIIDRVVRSTRDEAAAARNTFPEVSRIVVLTSRFHTRRACGMFEQVGFQVTCLAAPQRPRSASGQLYDYLYERLASWKYGYRHWLSKGEFDWRNFQGPGPGFFM